MIAHRIAIHFLAISALMLCNVAAATDAAEVAAIHAVDQVWLKSYNSGDANTISSIYAEDAVLLPPGASAVHGRAAIKAFLTKEMAATAKAGMVFGLDPKPDGGVSGDMGWASGTYTVKDKTGKVVETGKYLSVSKKKDGKWLYVRDTWNADGALSAPPTKK